MFLLPAQNKILEFNSSIITSYTESMNKFVKICTYLKKWWPRIVFLEGTDPEYIDQILDYTENAEHDDAPDSAACVCRILDKGF